MADMAAASRIKSPDSQGEAPAASAPRVGQACQSCRRKKVKCDGKQPCHNCSSRNLTCEFPEVKDHAAASRFYTSSFEARCQQMDSVCQRLETLAHDLSRVSEALNRVSATSNGIGEGLSDDLVQAANVLQSFPDMTTPLTRTSPTERAPPPLNADIGAASLDSHVDVAAPQVFDDESSNFSDDEADDDEASVEQDPDASEDDQDSDQAGALVTDSYGRLRFIGGATNKMLLDAAKNMSPVASTHSPASGARTDEVSTVQQNAETPSSVDVEFPFFVRGRVWPELPYLPKPEQLARPPRYVSDLLIGLYFEKLHYTFPVLFKPHFMQRYERMLRQSSSPSHTVDKEFLLVYFAVCACAAGLLPATSERGFPGLEYYEKALLLHYASPGQASLESVQCLALLAMCSAGWNTLTQSWNLAGQAVRQSMDIGLHLSSRFVMSVNVKLGRTSRTEVLKQQIARRTWWSIYCLERVVSICLGRPMAVQDKDCSCELPFDMSDEDLEQYCIHMNGKDGLNQLQSRDGAPSPLTGFIAFARLCHISGRIQQLGSPLRLRQLKSFSPRKTRKYLSRVASLDRALREWLETLPDSIRFSANSVGGRDGGDPGLVMCVIIFIMHAGSLLSLYRYLVRDRNRTNSVRSETEVANATAQCISAAQSCINAAELLRDLVPPSHYLAISVHCLTLSGVALLRMSTQSQNPEIIADAEKCIRFLDDLEPRWSGASRSRSIIQQLLVDYRGRRIMAQEPLGRDMNALGTSHDSQRRNRGKRLYSEFEMSGDVVQAEAVWHDVPWSDLLAFDTGEIAPMTFWSGT